MPGLCTLRVGVRLKGDGEQPEQIVVHWQSARELVARLGGSAGAAQAAQATSGKTAARSGSTARPAKVAVRRTMDLGF